MVVLIVRMWTISCWYRTTFGLNGETNIKNIAHLVIGLSHYFIFSVFGIPKEFEKTYILRKNEKDT